MILRIDDTDVERNTEASLNSIFDGLRWLDLGWDEQYKQSERLALHRQAAEAIFAKGMAYRDFTPPGSEGRRPGRRGNLALQSGHARDVRAPKATAAPPPASRSRCASACRATPSATSLHRRRLRRAIEIHRRYRGFRPAAQRRHADLPPGLLRRRCRPAHQPHHPRPGPPHQHLQARPDFRSRRRPRRPHSRTCRCWSRPMAPSSPSASTARWSASPPIATPAFCPHAFVNFLCLLGWSPKDDRERMTREELTAAFSLRRHQPHQRRGQFHRGRSVRSQGRLAECRAHPRHARRRACRAPAAGGRSRRFRRRPRQNARSSRRWCRSASAAARRPHGGRFLLRGRAAALRLRRADSAKRATPRMALRVLERGRSRARQRRIHARCAWKPRCAQPPASLGIKAGQMFEPIRVAVCGRKNAPPLFGTLEVLGRETCLKRIRSGHRKTESHMNPSNTSPEPDRVRRPAPPTSSATSSSRT